ncbi:hypothetical protein Rsub_05786 [Raphidocelis subcapitata]|uniref:Uncharacterized protein n=1 Tax=Raphidocelis subcapitata TaxID=307507 RepID=A0A2V0P522_9CHLO|nr:hypothetical protein Rsub_05786 [Raphidocelis subcapitata]|eukprot:GBF92950.1 hypothetical protein Rsub_05786 [Raphidocelis subcapitata]
MAHGKRKKAAQKSLNIVSIDPERRAELEASVQERRLCAMRAAAPGRAAKPAPRGGGAHRPAVPQEAAPAPPPPPPPPLASDGGAEDAVCLVAFVAPSPADAKPSPPLPAAEAPQLQRAPSSASAASEALPFAPPSEHEAASEPGDSPFTEEEETTDDGAWSSSCFTDDAFASDAPPPADEPPAGPAEEARLGAEEGGAPANKPLAAPLECDFTAGNMLFIAAAVPLPPDDGGWDADADAPSEADAPDDDWAPADDPSWQKSPVPQPAAAAADAARAELAFADGAAAAVAADEALAALARLQAAGAGDVAASEPQPPLPAAADVPSRRGSRSGEADDCTDIAAADRPDAPLPPAEFSPPKPAGPPSRERDSGPDASEAGDGGCEAAVRPPVARGNSKTARRVKRFWSKFVSAFGGGCCRAPAVRV